MLKLSQFTISTDISDTEVAIYNTLTNAFAVLGREVWEKYLVSENWYDHPYRDDLMKYGFVVLKEVDEWQTFLLWRNKVKYHSSNLTFTVLTTFLCNLACKYCMQEPVHVSEDVSKKMVDAEVAEFIGKVVQAYNPSQVNVAYFGGEPLLNMEGIEATLTRLKRLLPEKIRLKQTMTTNGVLVPRYIDRIQAANITTLQITLDGPPEVHDVRRVSIGGQGTFQEVFNGISAALDAGLFVAINIVIDAHNAPHIGDLAKFLRQHLGEYVDGFAINVGLASNPGWDSRHCALYISDAQATAEQFTQVVEAVLDEGLPIIDFLSPSPCPRERDNEFIISPDGRLYKCISGVGRDAFLVGNIADPPLVLAHKSAPFVNFGAPTDQCRKCTYLPYCNGGCRFNAWVNTADAFGVDCWREFHEVSLPRLLRLYANTFPTSRPLVRRKGNSYD